MQHDLDAVERLAGRDHHLAVVATTRADGTVQSSVVNAGVIDHPVSEERVVAFVTYGAAKLAHLRARPHATLTFRAGSEWIAVEPVRCRGLDARSLTDSGRLASWTQTSRVWASGEELADAR